MILLSRLRHAQLRGGTGEVALPRHGEKGEEIARACISPTDDCIKFLSPNPGRAERLGSDQPSRRAVVEQMVRTDDRRDPIAQAIHHESKCRR